MSGGYRIGLVRARNFGPFADVEYDLSRSGLTVIEGEFHGHGCDSNGSGKSYLIEAPVWCVWGSTLRPRVGKGDVTRLLFDRDKGHLVPNSVTPKDGCWVETHLVGGDKAVKIARYVGHPVLGNRVKLFIDGTDVTQGRDVMTQAAIEQLVGLDYRTAVNSVFFGASEDARGFFSATDSERKAVMDRVIGLEVYGRALEVARAKLRDARETRGSRQARLDALTESLAVHERMMAEVSCPEEIEERAWRVKLSLAGTRMLQHHEGALTRWSKRVRDVLRGVEEELRASLSAFEAVETEYNRLRSGVDRKLREAERGYAEADAEARVASRQVDKWDEMVGRRCPTCLQVTPALAAKKLKAQAQAAHARYVQAAEEHRANAAALVKEVDALVVPVRPSTQSEELRTAHAQVRDVEAALQQCQQGIRASQRLSKTMADELSDAQRRERKVAREVEKVREELDGISKELVMLDAREAHLSFWVEGFGNSGIKSFLIENEIPTINRIATSYALRLLGPGAQVCLSATRELKSGDSREELSVKGVIPGCTSTYATASKGQKKRLDLCLLLAFRQVVSDRSAKAFDQFFADELFDGLDETGEEFVVELLRDLSRKCPVILVTHSPRLKTVGDRVLHVEHQDGISTVRGRRSSKS